MQVILFIAQIPVRVLWFTPRQISNYKIYKLVSITLSFFNILLNHYKTQIVWLIFMLKVILTYSGVLALALC